LEYNTLSEMEENQIIEQLQALLAENSLDYDKIVSLTNELSKHDHNKVRFSVDADLISRLGNELVARQETALSELVKNAYDADATEVTLRFVDSLTKGGTLEIEDNGVGMTKEQLINGFMRISSGDKVAHPVSQIYHRKKAGQKGIGRFAVQRLGERLVIITKSDQSPEGYTVSFNWSEYQRDKELTEITNTIATCDKEGKGTKLIIQGLKDKWNEVAIQRMYRYLLGILKPEMFGEDDNLNLIPNIQGTTDSGFSIKAFITVDGKDTPIKIEFPKLTQFALAYIEGEVDDNGYATYSIRSERLNMNLEGDLSMDPDREDVNFSLIKNVKIKAYYFHNDFLPKNQKTAFQRYLRDYGGLRLYRNGFRVLPYAEPNNDWLSLDESQKKNSILPPHNNQNFYGIVEINQNSGDFEETSSREGLMENETFIQLQNFGYRTLVTAAIAIAQVRNVKIKPGQKKDEEGNWEAMSLRVKNIAFSLDELDKAIDDSVEMTPASKDTSKDKIKKLRKDIQELRKLQKEERKRDREEKVMLRVLSSVGLTVEQFVHEIKYYLNSMDSDMKYLLDRLSQDAQAMERLGILDRNFSNFRSYVSYMDSAVANNVNRELKPVELRDVVNPFVESLSDDARKSGITIEKPVYNGYNLYTRPMHPSEWTSILFNFYTNSKKAIKRTKRTYGQIHIECGKEGAVLYLEFSDNGDGISKENEEKIFDEFFTTSTPRNISDQQPLTEVVGSGLGLTIVKDIVESYRGTVKVVNPRGDYATCIRVEVPALSEKEIFNL
jgi:signal transduction histidine kinase